MATERRRWTILLLFGLFLAPVVVAILMHSEWWDFRPQQTRNHGKLVEPAIKLPEPLATTLRKQTGEGMWSLLLAAPEGCASDCRRRLAWLNRVQLAQGQHSDAVQIILATAKPVAADSAGALRRVAPALVVVDGKRGSKLLELAPGSGMGASYIIDPEGFIILSYAASADPSGIRKDLDRLLTWSQRHEPDSPTS